MDRWLEEMKDYEEVRGTEDDPYCDAGRRKLVEDARKARGVEGACESEGAVDNLEGS